MSKKKYQHKKSSSGFQSGRTMKRSVFILLFLSLFGGSADLYSQIVENDSLTASVGAPYVYLDCRRCDYDFIRTELTFVNYVRDPEQADIHIFITDVTTAGGGREYQFSFLGRRIFSGTQYTLKYHIDHNATFDDIRVHLAEYVKLGLASFMLQTPLAPRFNVEFNGNGTDDLQQEIDDPWNHWVIQAYLGSVTWDLESNQSKFNSRWGIFAERVTEEWKFRIRPYFNYGRIKIQTTKSTKPVVSIQRRHGLESYAIKSLNDHWSAGLFGTYYTFNGRNIKHEILISPGIEYSLFPYEEATRRSVTMTYQMGYGYHDYYEETIFNKTSEMLLGHQLKGVVNIQQPWGSIETGLVGSHYLHDFNRRRIELYGQTSVRLFEGFSLGFQVEYDVIRDQLSLPKGDASLEDVLLQQRELATDFSFSTSIAISYTFGSRYTNIVNTRF